MEKRVVRCALQNNKTIYESECSKCHVRKDHPKKCQYYNILETCPKCGCKYYSTSGPWCDCRKKGKVESKTEDGKPFSELIPQRNIMTHRHVCEIIKDLNLKHWHPDLDGKIFFDRMWRKQPLTKKESRRYSQSPWGKIDKGLSELQRTGYLTLDNIRLIKKAINVEFYVNNKKKWAIGQIEAEMDNRFGKKKKGGANPDWAFNYLLYALAADVRIYNNRPYWSAIAKYLFEENLSGGTFEGLRKRHEKIKYHDIMDLVKACYEAVQTLNEERKKEERIDFFPKGIKIPDLPIDFLTDVAHETGFKISPYMPHIESSGRVVSGQPLPDKYMDFYPNRK